MPDTKQSPLIPASALADHATPSSAWIVLNNVIWDVTDFLPAHPGGAAVIMQYLGRDATAAYNEVHSESLVSRHLDSSKRIGLLDPDTLDAEWTALNAPPSSTTAAPPILKSTKPPLDAILNMHDFAAAAEATYSPKAWAFYSGAANDCLTHAANLVAWRDILLRPRVLTGVRNVSTKTRVLGADFSVPFFWAPTALARMAHPEGEKAIARGLAARGSSLCLSTNSSFSLQEVVAELPRDYPVMYQLYVNKDRAVTEAHLRGIAKLRPRAIVVTVDLPVVGKREADERIKTDVAIASADNLQQKVEPGKKVGGLARATGGFIDADLRWEDLAWLRGITDIPLFLKGIQSAADARRAYEAGCAGIYLSNHGGRAVDTAQPAIIVLLEIQAQCAWVLERMEVFVDGGVRRGTDVLKAMCLGASAVFLGRPFLYAVGYGQEGVEHAVDLLRDELETAMQMCGITELGQAHPGLVNTALVEGRVMREEGHPFARKIVRARL
ncbi:hypothetical protein EJ06DRAFT_531741 [Trichodelitschia bisporula]|uniref:L-lactate dehydrogenase (cytochrome) n=1 Tax=Trichodelitschia bisporula TaxID=703511 RepID=A0A6G1HRL8_9PEZI|nr:hypothetical protein EJ06DRAFT_531741 [Trichodelitschia bisporula]